MESEIYGLKFRQIRKQMNINLIDASRGITSKSSLARWEKGQDNLSWTQVLQLLSRNHVQPIEFIHEDDFSCLVSSLDKIFNAYNNNQAHILRTYALNELKKYMLDSESRENLFKAAIACNYYKDLTGIDLLPKSALIKLKTYFMKIISGNNFWNFENIFYLGNTTFLMKAKDTYSFTHNLIAFIKSKKAEDCDWYSIILKYLLNSELALIKSNVNQAEVLLSEINNLRFPEYYFLDKVRMKFMYYLIQYIRNKDNTKIKAAFLCMEFFDFQIILKKWKRIYAQVNEIYFEC